MRKVNANLILNFGLFQKNGCLYEHIRWGEAFVIVYSVSDRHSFHEAQEILSQLAKLKLPSYYTSLLLGNKRDLDHSRSVLNLLVFTKNIYVVSLVN